MRAVYDFRKRPSREKILWLHLLMKPAMSTLIASEQVSRIDAELIPAMMVYFLAGSDYPTREQHSQPMY
jgi:hypothetical protein